jgi:signal transduction histidine kinase
MSRRVGIRSKLLALVAAPMVVIIALAALIVLQFRDEAVTAERQVTVTKGLPYLAELEVLLQQERVATSMYLLRASPAGLASLKVLRDQTDKAFVELRAHFGTASLGQVAPDAAITANALANNGFEAITNARKAIDAGKLSYTGMRTIYNGLTSSVITVPSLLAQSLGDPALARSLRAYQSVLQVAEYAVQERDLLSAMYASQAAVREQIEGHAALMGAQGSTINALGPLLRDEFPGQRAAIDAAIDGRALATFRADLARAATTGRMDGNVAGWNKESGQRIERIVASAKVVAAQISSNASANAVETRRTEYLVIALAVLVLLVVVLLTVALGRRITRPLRELTDAARDMSEKLPTMVEQMQRPGDQPDLEIQPITVRSRDEVGELAEAFNSVNEVTVRVAGEQAALRGSIAEMFTNMARRNQVLLDRQLAFLDRLEAREEDPDTLENLFRLDHLATRMRRNSESLLVLAGIDAARKLRQPMPLSDVIRAAIGGIEAYDRVDLSVTDDVMISGRVAMSLSHLFAELLENATHFSNPDTRVWVSASAAGDGLVVVVRDQGLGMTDEELAEANERIVNPPVTELAVAQRLGFFVVGRLSQRLGATVRLAHGPRGGVIAEVELPAELSQGTAVPAAPGTADTSPIRPPLALGSPESFTVVPSDDADLPTRSRNATPAAADVVSPIPMPRIDDSTPAPTLPTRSTAPVDAAPPVYTPPPVDAVPAADAVDTVPALDALSPLDATATLPVVDSAPAVAPLPVADIDPAPVAHSLPVADADPVPAEDSGPTVAPAPGRASIPAVGRVPVESMPDAEPMVPPVAPPVAARTILPTREKGLLRRRSVTPVPPPVLPSVPRHAAQPTLPGITPTAAPVGITSAPAAPIPVRLPPPSVEVAPAAPVALPSRGVRPEVPAPVAVAPVAPAPAPVAAPVPVPVPAPAPADTAAPELSPLAQLSQLASASYTPEVVATAKVVEPVPMPERDPERAELARRQPATVPVGAVEDTEQPTRPRAAGDVRSMLSGFRAGVQRGRDGAAHTNRPAHGVDNLRRD